MEQADQVAARVAAVSGAASLTVGVLADSAKQTGDRLAGAFRERHPGVVVRVREADLTDPTAGLRAGLVRRRPHSGAVPGHRISMRVLRADPVGVVPRTDDPLAGRTDMHIRDLADRPWFHFPEGTDPVWSAYWRAASEGERRSGPQVRSAGPDRL